MVDTQFKNSYFTAAGGTTPRYIKDHVGDIYNVKSFGAVGNGIADDTAAIQAAINAASAAGSSGGSNGTGVIVYFPSGSYFVTSSIVSTGVVGNGTVSLIGNDMHNTMIWGTIHRGFTVDKPDLNDASFQCVKNLHIINNSLTQGSGGLRMGFTEAAIIENVYAQGYLALDMHQDQFNSTVSNCIISGVAGNVLPGTLGLYCAQVTVISTSIAGFDIGYMTGGETTPGQNAGGGGGCLFGCRIEVCNTAIKSGMGQIPYTGSITGSQLTISSVNGTVLVGAQVYGNDGTGASAGNNLPGNITITSQISGTPNSVGVYQLSADPSSWTDGATFTGYIREPWEGDSRVVGLTTERCGTSIECISCATFGVSGAKLTGTVGPAHYFKPYGGTLTWSSAAGGTATLTLGASTPATLDDYGWTGGTRNIYIDSATPSGFDTYPSTVLATYVNSTTFTYPLAVNPGGPNTADFCAWSFMQQYGIKLNNLQNGTFIDVTAGVTAEQAGIYIGNFDGAQVTFIGCSGGSAGWVGPTAQKRDKVTFINCDFISNAMTYADLPGEAGTGTTPILGQTFTIFNAAKFGGGTPIMGDRLQGGGTNIAQALCTDAGSKIWKASWVI